MSYGKIFPLGGSGGSTSPSGIAGAIQFSNGSAFASDAANLFWDDTNNRLGIGTTTPLGILHLKRTADTTRMVMDGDAGQSKIITYRTAGLQRFGLYVNNTAESGSNAGSDFAIRAYSDAGTLLNTPLFIKRSTGNVGINTITGTAKLQVVGSGSTSATTSLLVQNSAGRTALKVADNGVVTIGADDKSGEQLAFVGLYGTRLRILTNSSVDGITGSVINSALDFTSNDLILSSKAASTTSNVYVIPTSFTSLSGSVLVNTTTDVASSVLTVNSTTKGVLFPRMTTAQKNAIATPANGLMVYDTDLARPCFFNGATWITL
jgi:hypothetical protein